MTTSLTPNQSPALQLRDVSLTFHKGSPDQRIALNNLSLQINAGDYVVVIGSNGAGKSTLLNVIAGSVMPDTGTVTLHGRDVTRMPVHKRAAYIGRVFQDPMLGTAPALSIEENLALAGRRGLKRGFKLALNGERRKRYADLLKPFGLGLDTRLGVSAGLLSGGQRQVLALLMASLCRPQLLLLDEHTAALDPGTADLVMHATQRLIEEEQLTALMITHNMQQAIDVGNRLLALNAGRVHLDLDSQAKAHLTVERLVEQFAVASDRQLLQAGAQ
ncbi:MAG TPA: ATP-binding cassette domain-containing protein [Burkholderiaceae bacterium]|nr:ATP-binding cassette domain-containing protein [Burkholderiaceae bacterium]